MFCYYFHCLHVKKKQKFLTQLFQKYKKAYLLAEFYRVQNDIKHNFLKLFLGGHGRSATKQ